MTDIGYATLSIIPSLDGVSKSVQAQLGALDGKKFGKAFGKDIAAGVQASEADVKRAFDSHAKLADRAADATGKLKVAQAGYQDLIDKGIGSGKRYEQAKAQLEKATRDEVRATRQATEALKDYEAAQKRAAAGVDSIGSGLGAKLKSLAGDAASGGSNAAAGFVEGFGGPIAALGTKAGPIGLALAAAAGLALGAGTLIAKQVMAGMDREVAADRIQAQLGLSDADAARFGESAGRVYGGAFGESMGDVQQAMSDVASTLGMSSGAGLEDMTAKALTFRDVFGTDVAESIALAQNMIVNGLAPDASTAFDLMTTASQRFPAAMRDELPEVLNEYSTYFQSLGFSGEEAIGMLVKIAPQGKIALDKLGDSLKELTIRATDLDDKGAQDMLAAMGLNGQDVANNLLAGGGQANQQFDQIIDKLLGIQDPANQAAAAIALFGTPLEDLDKAKIPAFLASMDDAASSMQGFAGSSQEMVDTVGSNAATSVESAKRAIESGMASMQSSLAQAFGPSIEQIANFLIEHQDQITGFFTTAANAGAEFGSAMIGIVGVVTRAFGMIVQGVGDAAGWINDGFAKIVGSAAAAADAVGLDGLAGDLRGAQDQLQTMADDLHSAGNGIVDFSDSMLGASMNLHDFDANMGSTQTSAQNAAAQIESVGTQIASLPSGAQINIEAIVVYKDQAGRAIDPAQLLGYNPNEFATAAAAQRARRGQPPRTVGPVTPTVASTRPPTPFTLPSASSSSSSSGAGGSSSGGGGSSAPTYFDPSQWRESGIDAALLANVPAGRYTQDASRDLLNGLSDCSSSVGDLVNMLDGLPTGPASGERLTTHNATNWLTQRGFVPGAGGPGDFRVGFDAGHMEATLPDGTNFNWGSDAAAARGGVGGQGAASFPNQYYRPVAGGSVPNASIPVSAAGGGYEVDQGGVYDAESKVLRDQQELEEKRLKLLELKADGNAKQSEILAAENDIEQQRRELESSQMKLAEAKQGKWRDAASGGRSGGSSGGGSGLGFGVPSSLGGFGQSFGGAIGSFFDGQVSSALGVLGVPESPGWLQGISTLIGGMSIQGPGGQKIGGGSAGAALGGMGSMFGNAGPVAAKVGLGGGAPPPDAAHGARAGQPPGPTYNIRTATVEDAFMAARRRENELALARLSSR